MKKQYIIFLVSMLLFAIVAGITGCGGGGSTGILPASNTPTTSENTPTPVPSQNTPTSTPSTSQEVTGVISPSGGTLIYPGIASVIFPPGAVNQDTTVTIKEVSPTPIPGNPDGGRPIGLMSLYAIEFTATAGGQNVTSFNSNVQIVLYYDNTKLSAGYDRRGIYASYWDGSAWIRIEGTLNEQNYSYTLSTNHFSQYGVFTGLFADPNDFLNTFTVDDLFKENCDFDKWMDKLIIDKTSRTILFAIGKKITYVYTTYVKKAKEESKRVVDNTSDFDNIGQQLVSVAGNQEYNYHFSFDPNVNLSPYSILPSDPIQFAIVPDPQISMGINFYNSYYLNNDPSILIFTIGHEFGHINTFTFYKYWLLWKSDEDGVQFDRFTVTLFTRHWTEDLNQIDNLPFKEDLIGLLNQTNWGEEYLCDKLGVEYGTKLNGYTQRDILKGSIIFFERVIADFGDGVGDHPSCTDRINRLLTLYPQTNNLPVILSITAPSNLQINQTGQIVINASDQDGDILTYYPTYIKSGGSQGALSSSEPFGLNSLGKPIKWSNSNTIDFKASLTGEYHITITVKDGSGGTGVSRECIINVLNTPDPNTGNWTVTVD